MRRTSILGLGLLALAALAALCVGVGAPEIQADVLACTQLGLREAGMAGVITQADGRDVTLAGPGADAALEEEARLIARGCGARTVVGDWTGGPTGPYTTLLCVDRGRADLSGSVQEPGVGDQVSAGLRERAGVTEVEVDLRPRDGAPPGHARMLEQAALELPQLEEGCIEFEDGDVGIVGSIRSQGALDGMVERLTAAAGDDFRLTVDVVVPTLSESARACQVAYDEMLGPGARVLFGFDSTELHEEGRRLLDTVEGIWAERCPDVSIVVAGHTDDVGDPAYNRTLSLERAQAVVDYLVQDGFDPEKLTAVGYGASQPRASNETDQGRAQNRRIEFRIQETGR